MAKLIWSVKRAGVSEPWSAKRAKVSEPWSVKRAGVSEPWSVKRAGVSELWMAIGRIEHLECQPAERQKNVADR